MVQGVRVNCSNGEVSAVDEVLPPPTVPMVIKQLQFRKALREVGRIAAFRTYITGLTADEREDWQFSPTIRRTEPMVLAAQTALNVTDAQLDTFFLRAAEI